MTYLRRLVDLLISLQTRKQFDIFLHLSSFAHTYLSIGYNLDVVGNIAEFGFRTAWTITTLTLVLVAWLAWTEPVNEALNFEAPANWGPAYQ